MHQSSNNADSLTVSLANLLESSEPLVTLFANAAAFIYESFDQLNWAGFYLLRADRLHLGPFIGSPACTQIELGKGVCGTAASRRETIVVENVDEFPGHIACDARSRSEIVVPMILFGSRLIGVLDLDSPELGRFGQAEQVQLEALRDVLTEALERAIESQALDVERLFI